MTSSKKAKTPKLIHFVVSDTYEDSIERTHSHATLKAARSEQRRWNAHSRMPDDHRIVTYVRQP